MARTYLLDSNAIIDYLMEKLPLSGIEFMNKVVDDVPNVSVISQIEVLGFPMMAADEAIFKNFFNDSNVFHLSLDIIEKTIDIRKHYKLKVPDALIAATALVYDYGVISRNIKDFSKVPILSVIDPHDIDRERVKS